MKKVVLSIAILGLCSYSWGAQTKEDTIDRTNKAGEVLHEVLNAPDKGVPEEVLEGAKCVAVVPHLVKAAFVFGGEHGRGVVTCKTAHGWSAPAFFAITGGSWGAQIGAESTDLVMMYMSQEGADSMMKEKFKIGADASAAAGPVGRHASAGTDWQLNTGILTYSRSKGLFAGVSLNGAEVERDEDSTRAFYGRDLSIDAVLKGRVPVPPSAEAFVREVRRAKVVASNK